MNKSEGYTPTEDAFERPTPTPAPMVVAINGLNQSDNAPDSTRPVSLKQEKKRGVSKFRKLTRFTLSAAAAATFFVGSHAKNVSDHGHQQEMKANIAKVGEAPSPETLNRTQFEAIKTHFSKADGTYDYKAAKEMMNEAQKRTSDVDWQLPVGQFVGPDQKISEDGKYFEIDGQHYSIAKSYAENGNVYILAAQTYEEDNFAEEDRMHMIKPMLIGGAHYEADLSREELSDMAEDDARNNLEQAFEAQNKVAFSQDARNATVAVLAKN